MTRPTTIEGYREISSRFISEEGYALGLAYRPDPTDIFISPFAKCGTTWMQQIVHGLRTGGDMAFAEITEVVPWVEMAHDLGLDLYAPQKARPHAFKSHLSWHDIPKGGRYITVLRDPVDAMVSLFRFMEGWFFETGSIALADFAEAYMARDDHRNYWHHAASWWGQRDNPDVLLLAYEHMKSDLPGTVARVAEFMGGYPADRVALATQQASFDFMKAHADRFDDNLVHRKRDVICGLPADSASTKVNEGQAGRGQNVVTAQIRARLYQRWAEIMNAPFGLKSYADLLDQLRA
jgi:hypothetical protein